MTASESKIPLPIYNHHYHEPAWCTEETVSLISHHLCPKLRLLQPFCTRQKALFHSCALAPGHSPLSPTKRHPLLCEFKSLPAAASIARITSFLLSWIQCFGGAGMELAEWVTERKVRAVKQGQKEVSETEMTVVSDESQGKQW